MNQPESMSWHKGSCHCGAILFEVQVPDKVELVDCNCSICAMTGFQHLLVERPQLRILQGKDKLALYTFNTRTAQHTFCSICGVKPFYVPRSNPEGYSVNFRCLNPTEFTIARKRAFDGRNWEQRIHEFREPEVG